MFVGTVSPIMLTYCVSVAHAPVMPVGGGVGSTSTATLEAPAPRPVTAFVTVKRSYQRPGSESVYGALAVQSPAPPPCATGPVSVSGEAVPSGMTMARSGTVLPSYGLIRIVGRLVLPAATVMRPPLHALI